MINENKLSLMADIMDGITQTDEWTEIQMHNPGIKAAKQRFNKALEQAEEFLPRDLYVEIADSPLSVLSAYVDAAILYGIHVATVIQNVAANPSELSRFILENRMAEI